MSIAIEHHHSTKGFTLVEILIVVVILAILASIVIPQYRGATDEARVSATQAHLKTLREQFEVYRLHHKEQYPALADLWDAMLESTDEDGNPDANSVFGPYLKHAPLNPFTASVTIVATGTGTVDDGWEYDEATGAITAVGFDELALQYSPP